MKGNSMWSVKFSTIAIALIPIAVGINYLGKFIIEVLRLPLWLDSLGTVLSSMLAGPIFGAFCGILNNIVYGFTESQLSFVYGVTSGAIGLIVGIVAYKGWITSVKKALVFGLIVGFISAIVSTPLNMMFWGGITGNPFGDKFYNYLMANGFPQWLASFGDSVVIDVPDKIVTVFSGYLIYRSLPQSLVYLFKNDNVEEFK